MATGRIYLRARFRRSIMLLEAILALLFSVMTIGAVAGLLVNSISRTRRAEHLTRAMILAENKLAELQTGLLDNTQGSEGGFPDLPKFFWSYKFEPTEIPVISRLKITVLYDDPAEGVRVNLYRLFSPMLNMSSTQMQQVASDPSQLQEIAGGSGFSDILGYAEMFPGGDQIVKVFLAGGVPAMTELFNKLISGNISPEQLLQSVEGTEDNGGKSLIDSMAESSSSGKYPAAWTDYDTAGIGRKTTASAPADENKEGRRAATSRPAESSDTSMTRQEALEKIQEMLRRIAGQKK